MQKEIKNGKRKETEDNGVSAGQEEEGKGR